MLIVIMNEDDEFPRARLPSVYLGCAKWTGSDG